MVISKERYDYLLWAWGEESEDPETQEWRDELTEAEEMLVSSWDRAARIEIRKLCERILDLTPDEKPSLNV